MEVPEVEPVTLHRKPFIYTVDQMSDVSRATGEDLLTLRRTTVLGMNPMPCTNTAAFGTGRHVRRDREGSADCPNTSVVDTKNGQILRLDTVHVRSVGNGEGTTPQVIFALREIGLAVRRWADKVIRRLTVAKESSGRSCQSGQKNGRSWVTYSVQKEGREISYRRVNESVK